MTPGKFTLDQSLHLVRRAHKLDPSTELKLAKMLASLKFVTDDEVRFASRVLDVLERSPDPSTSLPALRLMMECPNVRLRSKAALLVGRINQNPQWADQGASELDWRVSANAVESLWGLSTPSVREAFLKAALHGNHRIASNGIVGLYLMGDECSIPFLFHLSKSESSLCRAAAAWAMGHLEDPRFVPRLTRMMSDRDEMTRKRAFNRSRASAKKMIQLRAAGAVQVQLRDVESRSGAHRIRFAVTRDGQFLKGLDARQLVIWSGPDLVEELSCSLNEGSVPFYEIAYQGPPSPTHLVKVQVYAPLVSARIRILRWPSTSNMDPKGGNNIRW